MEKVLCIFCIVLMLMDNVEKSECLCEKVKEEVKCASMSEISKTSLNQIPGINEVKRISIKWNAEITISPQGLQPAVKLERVVINYNKIDKIYSDTFRGFPLKYLTLGHNNINYIYPGAFVNLSLLERLRIDDNNLENIPLGLIKDLPIQDLALSKNKIRNIDNMALENLPNLRKLKLDHNKLQSIFVNRILTFPERLEILWLHNNSLSTLTNYMLQKLSNLKILNLGFNSISLIEENSFEHTPKLNYLVLTHNLLKEVDGSIFPKSGLDYLERMYLDGNKLMFLSSNFFARLGSLKKVTLAGNPWLCPCLTIIQRFLSENNVKEMCNEEYINGGRPVCINEKAGDTECRHSYNNELQEKYETYKMNNPLYKPIISCIL